MDGQILCTFSVTRKIEIPGQSVSTVVDHLGP